MLALMAKNARGFPASVAEPIFTLADRRYVLEDVSQRSLVLVRLAD